MSNYLVSSGKQERNMAFVEQPPIAFTRTAILALNPGQIGVYGIFNAQGWLYVGSGDIRERLLKHVNGDNAVLTASGPTGCVGEVTANYPAREKALILELQPKCNKKVG
jgi:predicted GIY-YIG superfamily endonuclease